ncbi:DDE-type integrase/transposase/recombinase [Streptomyces sp. NPDC024017]|uniref:DDE-type integrase/transposase/recombinase n=1 Tax=Streptomyces sp. NPDC024017 TaxID=3154326 RepID=UPI0033BFC79B
MRLARTDWVADFTYVPCWVGTVYVVFCVDAFSRRILVWTALMSVSGTDLCQCLRRAGRRDGGAGGPACLRQPGCRRPGPGSGSRR